MRHLDAKSVGEINVGPTVAVIVDEGDAATHGFDDVFLLGAGDVLELDSRGGGDVDELREIGGRLRRWVLGAVFGGKREQYDRSGESRKSIQTGTPGCEELGHDRVSVDSGLGSASA